jgi:hypothetical protein
VDVDEFVASLDALDFVDGSAETAKRRWLAPMRCTSYSSSATVWNEMISPQSASSGA